MCDSLIFLEYPSIDATIIVFSSRVMTPWDSTKSNCDDYYLLMTPHIIDVNKNVRKKEHVYARTSTRTYIYEKKQKKKEH